MIRETAITAPRVALEVALDHPDAVDTLYRRRVSS